MYETRRVVAVVAGGWGWEWVVVVGGRLRWSQFMAARAYAFKEPRPSRALLQTIYI